MSTHPVHPGNGAAPPSLPHPRPDLGLDDALRAAVARYYAGSRVPDLELEAAVCALVDVLHAQGLGVAQVLLAVKAQVAAGGATPSRLREHVVRCCIARYYDVPAGRGSAAGAS